MPIWRDVKCLSIHFGWDYQESVHKNWLGGRDKNVEDFNLCVPYKNFHSQMDKILEEINDYQYEIKAVMPLTEGLFMKQVNSTEGRSWGYGFGASTIVGYAILIEKQEEVSQEEYEKRRREAEVRSLIREGNARKEHLTAQIAKLQKEFDAVKDIPREIVEKKGMLGGVKYRIGGLEYTDKAEAQKLIDKNNAIYDKAFNELQAAKNELGKIEELLKVNAIAMENFKENTDD